MNQRASARNIAGEAPSVNIATLLSSRCATRGPLIPLTTAQAHLPAFTPLLPCPQLGSPDLSVVLVAAHPPILGGVVSSSPPRKSWRSLRVEPMGLPRTFPGSLAGSSPGKLPEPFFGENAPEFSQEFARFPLVLVTRTRRKEVPYDLRVFRRGVSSPRHRCQNVAPLAGGCPAALSKPSPRWPQKS
jgi:hypothetical protein